MRILGRDEFISEVYNPMMEKMEYDELVAINEGLIRNLFGKWTNDWSKIKGDEGIKKAYKEIDDKLTGFTTMKMFNKKKCDKIRQELVDFAGSWYEYQENRSKNGENMEMVTKIEFKDKALQHELDNCKENINNIAKGNDKMLNWARVMMNNIKTVINRIVYNECDDEETKKKIEEAEKEAEAKMREVNEKLEKEQNKDLKEISKERARFISNVQATPINPKMPADKAIKNLCAEFEKIRGALKKEKILESANGYDMGLDLINEASSTPLPDSVVNVLKSDSMLGFKSIFESQFKGKEFKNSGSFRKTFTVLSNFYEKFEDKDIVKRFKDNGTQSQSIQAMCIAINSFVKICMYGGKTDVAVKNNIDLMSKVAITSNPICGYGIPLGKKDDKVNYFIEILKVISDGELGDITETYKKKSEELIKQIVDSAKKISEEYDKKYNEISKKIKDENENSGDN